MTRAVCAPEVPPSHACSFGPASAVKGLGLARPAGLGTPVVMRVERRSRPHALPSAELLAAGAVCSRPRAVSAPEEARSVRPRAV